MEFHMKIRTAILRLGLNLVCMVETFPGLDPSISSPVVTGQERRR
jgi:hypothetical protein